MVTLRTEQRRKLKAIGLAEEIFDKDAYEKALALWRGMKARIEELENSAEFAGREFVWSKDRAAWKEGVATGEIDVDEEPGIEVVQSRHTKWRDSLGEWVKVYYSNGGSMTWQWWHLHRLKERKSFNPNAQYVQRLRAQGFDPEKIWQEEQIKRDLEARY